MAHRSKLGTRAEKLNVQIGAFAKQQKRMEKSNERYNIKFIALI
jgi:hypothetical protein